MLGTKPLPPIVAMTGSGRTYHVVPLERVAASQWTHIETCAPVVYVRHQADGDWHVTIARGAVKVVVEIIPALPLPVPKKGQTIRVRGISRQDKDHLWAEIHPLESWEPVAACKISGRATTGTSSRTLPGGRSTLSAGSRRAPAINAGIHEYARASADPSTGRSSSSIQPTSVRRDEQ